MNNNWLLPIGDWGGGVQSGGKATWKLQVKTANAGKKGFYLKASVSPCVCTLWNKSRTLLLYSKLTPLSTHVATTTNQREITTKQFVIFGLTSHLQNQPPYLRNHQGHAAIISQLYSESDLPQSCMFQTLKDPSKAEHITRIFNLQVTSSLHDFLWLAERNRYEIAKFTTTKGWDAGERSLLTLFDFFGHVSPDSFEAWFWCSHLGAPARSQNPLGDDWLIMFCLLQSPCFVTIYCQTLNATMIRVWRLDSCSTTTTAASVGCIPILFSFFPFMFTGARAVSSLKLPGPAEKLIRSLRTTAFLNTTWNVTGFDEEDSAADWWVFYNKYQTQMRQASLL